ncbi:MAG: alpha-amylase, partial [Ignavibacteriales bacterium]|nr:alpha-amylase [Ignavibacteriales bacterium]
MTTNTNGGREDRGYPTYEMHVAREARDRYEIDDALFTLRGALVVADFAAARRLARKINERRAETGAERRVTPGEINALGLLHEIFHYAMRAYEERDNPGAFARALQTERKAAGEARYDETAISFLDRFPPTPVRRGESARAWLEAEDEGVPRRQIALEEMIALRLENLNPAAKSLKELFDETPLDATDYRKTMERTKAFFKNEPPLSVEGLPLIDAFEKVLLENGDDLEKQLAYFHEKWRDLLPEAILRRLLTARDLIREDTAMFFRGAGKGTPPVPTFPSAAELAAARAGTATPDLRYDEDERYSDDLDWMPNVVMLAKNAFVWLNQLSKFYGRDIYRFDHVPDEELDRIARSNFNALWLIGVWERSSASQKVKRYCGNPEAAASAYSLHDYQIASQLGGEEAYRNLRDRFARRGVRLASDMVPNHTGVFSKWMIERPNLFMRRHDSPYPNYTFNGPDLSEDGRAQIRIEDNYYSREDAAVVFQRIDNHTGETTYVYHGNDGTSMPWNDTAQLDLLNPETREALIQTIVEVAKKFPIIRFDAAMTLTKKHYQRLWFPQPGQGGAIPSRTDYSMTRADFDRAMPVEFWREVVERVGKEAPDTLLLAEAFWLMEGFFVRTLGMHRVYNSAFMHMMMKEDNQSYKQVVKNTIEFDPGILKRYVNFMSNPDEETAVNQFGKGDKYFGVAATMATMPGLPMFGHGQVEGFAEKYGMEYYKAYYDEWPDPHLVERHEREIFPLLKRRPLFSESDEFELYDFIAPNGDVNHNVFAYSNRRGGERALFLYNNSNHYAEGFVKHSSGKALKRGADQSELVSRQVADALGLRYGDDVFYVFRDQRTGLERLRNSKELFERGYTTGLGGYEYQALLDFREKNDEEGELRKLAFRLEGAPVPSVERALEEMRLRPLHDALERAFAPAFARELRSAALPNDEETKGADVAISRVSDAFREQLADVAKRVEDRLGVAFDVERVARGIEEDCAAANALYRFVVAGGAEEDRDVLARATPFGTESDRELFDLLLAYIVVGRALVELQLAERKRGAAELFDRLMFDRPLWQAFIRLGDDYGSARLEFELLRILERGEGALRMRAEIEEPNGAKTLTRRPALLKTLERPDVRLFVGLHEAEGVEYFNKERFEALLRWEYAVGAVARVSKAIRKSREGAPSFDYLDLFRQDGAAAE